MHAVLLASAGELARWLGAGHRAAWGEALGRLKALLEATP
jgi:hypothetical protein